VPPNHLIDGYRGAVGERQPPMYFHRGGSTLKGISRPGEIVWSRIYVANDALHMDIGRGGVVRLSEKENQRRWEATTSQWPMMSAVLYGVSRDQFMAQHKANHIQVVYAPDAATARRALVRKASMARELGIRVNLCGDLEDSLDRHQKQAA
jgi:L-fucose isomerase-like protein